MQILKKKVKKKVKTLNIGLCSEIFFYNMYKMYLYM